MKTQIKVTHLNGLITGESPPSKCLIDVIHFAKSRRKLENTGEKKRFYCVFNIYIFSVLCASV